MENLHLKARSISGWMRFMIMIMIIVIITILETLVHCFKYLSTMCISIHIYFTYIYIHAYVYIYIYTKLYIYYIPYTWLCHYYIKLYTYICIIYLLVSSHGISMCPSRPASLYRGTSRRCRRGCAASSSSTAWGIRWWIPWRSIRRRAHGPIGRPATGRWGKSLDEKGGGSPTRALPGSFCWGWWKQWSLWSRNFFRARMNSFHLVLIEILNTLFWLMVWNPMMIPLMMWSSFIIHDFFWGGVFPCLTLFRCVWDLGGVEWLFLLLG